LLIYDPRFKLLSADPKPEFMLIGAAKCGSTSFCSYLSTHPQVRPTDFKEPNFWTWRLCDRARYQQLFVNSQPLLSAGPGQVIAGEYSTSSILHPLVPRRVRARLPGVRLVILLRNPIDRAYSHYNMWKRSDNEKWHSFGEIVRREIDQVPALLESHRRAFVDPHFRTLAHLMAPEGKPILITDHDKDWTQFPLLSDQDLFRFYLSSYVFRSIYHDQLWRWLQLFPREQFLIIQSERFYAHRTQVMNEVIEFLGLRGHEFSEEALDYQVAGATQKSNHPSHYAEMDLTTRKLLADFFAPFNSKLFELIGERYDWN
jgi:hypothetical protein